jgi:quercetin dioxygenase-like cupin family protein
VPAQALAKHLVKVAPKSAKVVFENEVVRVIEITLQKGQKIGMHSHKRNLTYGLNDSKFRSTGEKGKSSIVKLKKGDASWSEGRESHAVENLGGISRILSVEYKG